MLASPAGLTACTGDDSAEKQAAPKIVAEQETKDNKDAEDAAAATKAESDAKSSLEALMQLGLSEAGITSPDFSSCLVEGVKDAAGKSYVEIMAEVISDDDAYETEFETVSVLCMSTLTPDELAKLTGLGHDDHGHDHDDDNGHDFCDPEPDWWDEARNGPYPQIADCGWQGFPPDEEGEELIVFDDLGGLTREAAEDRLSGSVPAFHFYDVNSAAWGFSDESVFNRYILFLRDGIVVGYEIERLNGPLRFGENILLELPPPDAVCDDYSSLVGMTSDEAEQVLKDAGLNSDVEVLEGKQPHYSLYNTWTQGTGPRVEYPEPIVVNVAQNEDCSPVFERPTYPIWIMISASVGEHPPEG